MDKVHLVDREGDGVVDFFTVGPRDMVCEDERWIILAQGNTHSRASILSVLIPLDATTVLDACHCNRT